MRSPFAAAKARAAARRAKRASGSDPAFDAFISYSHAGDAELAKAIQIGLHRFARPWHRLRALRVFRDQASLATDPDLWGSIREALLGARYLILLASPAAARSEWVTREVQTWTKRHGRDGLLLVLTRGELAFDDAGAIEWATTTAVAPAIESAIAEEPRYLDLRWVAGEGGSSLRNPRFREAIADLAAPLHGKPKDALIGDDVREHRRARRLARGAVAAVAALAVTASVAAVVAIDRGNEARAQLAIASSRLLASQSVAVGGDQRAQSLLLGLEALGTRDTIEARGALLDAHLRTPSLRMLLQPASGGPSSVAISPDGTLLAAGTTTGDVVLWRWSDGRVYRVLRGPGRWITDVAFVARGDRLVTASEGGQLQRWDVRNGHAVGQPIETGRKGAVQSVAVDPSGRTMAAGTSGGEIGVWALDTGLPIGDLVPAHVSGVSAVAFTAGGSELVTSGLDGRVRRWTVAGLRPAGGALDVTRSSVLDLAASAGGPIALANQDGGVGLLRSGAFRRLGDHDGQSTSVDVDPEGVIVATGGFDNAVRLWDARSGTSLGRPLRGHIAFVADVAVAPAGHGVASVGADGVVAVWDLTRPSRLARTLHTGKLGREAPLAWTPDGRTLIAGGADGSVTRLDPSGGVPLLVSGARRATEVVSVAADPRGNRVAAVTTAGHDFPQPHAVELWDLRRASVRPKRLPLPPSLDTGAGRLAFSPDGQSLAAAGTSAVLVWRLGRDEDPRRLPGALPAFSPDSRTLAVTSGRPDEGTVYLYDARSGAPRGTLRTGRPAFVSAVAFGSDGRTVAAGDVDGTVVVWDVRRRTRLGEPLTGIGGRVDHVAFSPDGRILAAASSKHEVLLWDAETRRSLGRPIEGQFIAFGRGGRLVAATGDGTAHVWSLGIDDLRDEACALAGRNLNRAEWQQFIGPLREYSSTCLGLRPGRPAIPAASAG